MDELSTETKREIVKLVFPDLRYGGDPDVERYFELRRDGRLAQALSIYNGALRVRYPADSDRVLLLKLYRERDPRYGAFQEELLLAFADRLALRIKRNIDLVTAPLEKADLSDALRALKAVESVLARIPGGSEAAIALLARYAGFARAMRYRERLVERAVELVREYDAVSRADSPADYDFVARSEALEEKRRASSRGASGAAMREDEGYDFVSRSAELERKRKGDQKSASSYFDPDRIKFSAADRARVEIAPELTRREDKVIAFCAKYWPFAADAAFERTVFLYSRKYGTRHFEIYRAIKIGRARKATDDEILSAVSGILTTSYNYSVSGDLYMQVMWRRLRARMEARAVAERLAAPGPEATTRAKVERAPESKVRKARAAQAAEEAAPAIPPPPAGDVEPTSIRSRAALSRGFAAPPSFALREATTRASSRSEAPAQARGLDLRSRSEAPERPQEIATRSRFAAPSSEEEKALGLRAASRAAALPTSRTQAPTLPPEAAMPPRPSAPARLAAPKAAAPVQPAAARAASVPAKAGAAPRNASSRAAAGQGRTAAATKAAVAQAEPTLRPAAKAKGARLLGRLPAGPEPVREIRAKRGSISDHIRKLSGRGYDVYREIFLERVRDHIRRALLANQTRGHGLFDTAANEAEDQVFDFISAHYDDPFMDWEHSAERDVVEALGFALPSLDPIIESCFRKLQ